MLPDTVLLIGLPPGEIQQIQEMANQMDPTAKCVPVPSVEQAGAFLSSEAVALVIFHPDPARTSPAHLVRRIKGALRHEVPSLVLVSHEKKVCVREYLRAGVDEFWILPIDSTVFPPRFQVLLEMGRSSAAEEPVHGKRHSAGSGSGLRWQRFVDLLRRVLVRDRPLAPELSPSFAGHWRKLRRLGFGSFGEVWLVEGSQKQSLAVAKIPHSAKLNTRFIREAAILRRLAGHPNAVGLIEVLREEGKVVLIEEYAKGPTLQELLDHGMEASQKERVFLELLNILSYAHARRIMHRDVKPENIVVVSPGGSKLLDFGTGKDLARRSTSSTVVGSRPYMAPEQIAGKSRLASDVWAAGVILYAFCTGLLPFYDDNEKKLMDMILECEPEPPRNHEPGIAEGIESIVLRCLEKDPDHRYADAGELERDLTLCFPHFGDGSVLPPA